MRLRVVGILIAATLILAQAPPAAHVAPPAPNVVRVPPDEAVAILGQPVAGPDGKAVGRLIDVLVNEDGRPTAAVIDVGGFLGVGARRIAVRWNALHFAPGATNTPITLDWTIDQIKAAPEYANPAKPAPVVVAAPKPAAPPATSAAPAAAAPPAAANPHNSSAAPASSSAAALPGTRTPPSPPASPSPR